MKRALVLSFAMGLCLAAGAAEAQGEKPSEIKELMQKLNKPSDGLFTNIGAELRSDTPDWAEIQPQAKEVAKLIAALGKKTPPKGEKNSWAKLTKSYSENAVALEKAIAAKDQETAKSVYMKMGRTACAACHSAHRKD